MQTSWSCCMQDVKPTNEPDGNQPPLACLSPIDTRLILQLLSEICPWDKRPERAQG